MISRAQRAFDNLTPTARLFTTGVPVVLMLSAALMGMADRERAVPATETAVIAAEAPSLRITDSWDASSVVVVGELAMEATVVGGESGTPPAAVAPVPLNRDEMLSVLRTAGWPEEWLYEAVSIACGPAWDKHRGIPAPSGESLCHPDKKGDGGNSLGLFQIQPRFWGDRCGVDGFELMYPLVNARCALIIVRYSESAGLSRWHYWSTAPVVLP